MDNREVRTDKSNDVAAYKVGSADRKGLKWLLLLLALLLIALLAFILFMNNDEDKNNDAASSSQSQTESSQNDSDGDANFTALQQKYDAQFMGEARVVYFSPDTTQIEDGAATAAKLDAIAMFIKDNPEAKLQANGSIFDANMADATSALAKQRAELVKTHLVEKGVKAEAISVSTVNNYEGQDDAARATYARSVTVTLVK